MKPGACTGPYSLCGKSWKQSIYNPRANTSKNRALKAILAHNLGKEKEHAAVLLGWICRHSTAFDMKLKDYLFSSKLIAYK